MDKERQRLLHPDATVDYQSARLTPKTSNSGASFQVQLSESKNASAKSSGDDMASKSDKKKLEAEADLLSASNLTSLENQFRRKLYNELPFISAFGMTTRESAFKKTMSMDGLSMMNKEAEVRYAHINDSSTSEFFKAISYMALSTTPGRTECDDGSRNRRGMMCTV